MKMHPHPNPPPKGEGKEYLIGGVVCRLKKLSLDETDEVNALLQNASSAGEQVDLNNEQTKIFLSIVLEPKNSREKINPGKAFEDTAIEILRDFFLMRINKALDIKKSFTTLVKKVR